MEAIHLAYVLVFALLAVFVLRLRRRGASPAEQPARATTAHCPYPNPVLGNRGESSGGSGGARAPPTAENPIKPLLSLSYKFEEEE